MILNFNRINRTASGGIYRISRIFNVENRILKSFAWDLCLKNLCPCASSALPVDCSKQISARSAARRAIKRSAYPADWQWNTDKRGFARIDTDLCCLETEVISVRLNLREIGVYPVKKAFFDGIYRISRIFNVENRILKSFAWDLCLKICAPSRHLPYPLIVPNKSLRALHLCESINKLRIPLVYEIASSLRSSQWRCRLMITFFASARENGKFTNQCFLPGYISWKLVLQCIRVSSACIRGL